MVLNGFATTGNLSKMTEVLRLVKERDIKLNAQSYAALFECVGRLKETDENLKLLRKYQNEAASQVTFFTHPSPSED